MRVGSALALLVFLFAAACGGETENDDQDGGGTVQVGLSHEAARAAAGDNPWVGDLEGSRLSPGTYAATRFTPQFTIEFANRNWQVIEGNAPNLVIFAVGRGSTDELPFLDLVRPLNVFDPDDARRFLPVPDDLVAWLRQHPYVKTGAPSPITVGGVAGQEFDVAVRSIPDRQPSNCFGPCVPLFPVKQGESPPYALYKGVRGRFIVLAVDDEPLVIGLSALPDDFPGYVPRAHEVLRSLAFL